MKATVLLLFFVLSQAMAESANETSCRIKWTDKGQLNKRMYESCVEELDFADKQFVIYQKQHENEAWFKNVAAPGCNEKWTHEGHLQTELALYCYRQEQAAFVELQYQSHLPSFNSACAEACYNVWKTKTGSALTKTFECYRARAEAPRPSLPKTLQLLIDASGPSTETAAGPSGQPASARTN
jgi:hypothetical protein